MEILPAARSPPTSFASPAIRRIRYIAWRVLCLCCSTRQAINLVPLIVEDAQLVGDNLAAGRILQRRIPVLRTRVEEAVVFSVLSNNTPGHPRQSRDSGYPCKKKCGEPAFQFLRRAARPAIYPAPLPLHRSLHLAMPAAKTSQYTASGRPKGPPLYTKAFLRQLKPFKTPT